jgi:uncharacterized RmlC-like cupin family protein
MINLPPVRIINPARFDKQTAQTPGSQRQAAVARDLGIESRMCGGLFMVEPGTRTAIHHHGEQETIAYVLRGECYIRWGERGEFGEVAHQGDFIHVPAWLAHMDINCYQEKPFEWVVVRSTGTPIVVNLPDDYWPLTTGQYARTASSL